MSGLAAVALAASLVGFAPVPDRPPRPFPAEVLAAWQKAGGKVLWFRRDKFGALHLLSAKDGKDGNLPLFQFRQWQEGMFGKLPSPPARFGVSLQYSHVTDVGMKELAALKHLEYLDLTGTKVTDKGVKDLAGLMGLRALDLSWAQTTDAGLKEIAGLKSLQSLHLNNTQVTDVGLRQITGLKFLQVLGLIGTNVTDAGLKELAGLKSLQDLALGEEVTGAGLKELAGLKSLRKLSLRARKSRIWGLRSWSGSILYKHSISSARG